MISALNGQGINVRHACRMLGVSEWGYYAWRDRPDLPGTLRRIWLAGEIADVHKASLPRARYDGCIPSCRCWRRWPFL